MPASAPPLDAEGTPMRSSHASIPPVSHRRYRLGAELGRGGMGRVVEAFDTQLGRTVAVKEVLAGPNIERRFIREVEITARLEHASIIPLYDSGTSPDGRPFYVMRRVTGRPLDEMVTRAHGLGERLTLLPAVLSAIDAVAHAHKRGVIHRDLKPANILVGELGETVVIDWGLAKVIGEDEDDELRGGPAAAADSLQTQIGSVFGTPGFMAPEQARGEAMGPTGDVYALGATLYHVLAGSPPHAGGSATAIIGRTLAHDVKPLDEAAPGAPPELVAIVDKALAFDAAARYQDASTLGEDVRRFLAGQLVAAHRYTPQQRLVRFGRRHRTALVVAALGTVAVAALAWFSVHRIVQERDAANQARRAALEDKLAAEGARDNLADRNDALLVTQARSLLDTNPTESLAVLKQLAPTSTRLAEARAIGQAAVARGVWSAIQSSEVLTTYVELSPDGRELLQVTRDNILRVWDLDRKRLVIARPFGTFMRALWVAGGRVLVAEDQATPQLLDPAANLSTPLPLEPIDTVFADDAGTHLIVVDVHHAAFLFDLGSQIKTPLWGGHPVKTANISPDGQWGVVADGQTAVAFDARGNELVRRDIETLRIVTSRARTFAISSGTSVTECTVDPTPACTNVPLPNVGRPIAIDMTYRGRELVMYVGGGYVIGWNGSRTFPRAHIDQYAFGLSALAEACVVISSLSGKLQITGGGVDHTITIPTPVAQSRIATRWGQSKIVVAGDGQIIVADLSSSLPRSLPDSRGLFAEFTDDNTLLTWRVADESWSWLDLTTGEREQIEYPMRGLPQLIETDAGRALFRDEAVTHSRLLELRKGSPVLEIAAAENVWGRLIPGDAIVYGAGDGRLFAKIGARPGREVATLVGNITSAVALGPLRFAALSEGGELVRADLSTGSLERTHVDFQPGTFLSTDAGGRVLIVVGDRLLMWDDHILEVTRFKKPVRGVAPAHGSGVLVTLSDHDVLSIGLEPGARPHRLIGGGESAPVLSRDGLTLVSQGNGAGLTIVELEAAVRWSLPTMFATQGAPSVSPSSRHIVQRGFDGLMIWTLPTTSSDFASWLDEQTNATRQGDDVLAWPWQVTKP